MCKKERMRQVTFRNGAKRFTNTYLSNQILTQWMLSLFTFFLSTNVLLMISSSRVSFDTPQNEPNQIKWYNLFSRYVLFKQLRLLCHCTHLDFKWNVSFVDDCSHFRNRFICCIHFEISANFSRPNQLSFQR